MRATDGKTEDAREWAKLQMRGGERPDRKKGTQMHMYDRRVSTSPEVFVGWAGWHCERPVNN